MLKHAYGSQFMQFKILCKPCAYIFCENHRTFQDNTLYDIISCIILVDFFNTDYKLHMIS